MAYKANSSIPLIELIVVGVVIAAELVGLWFLDPLPRLGVGLLMLLTGAVAVRVLRTYREQQKLRRQIEREAT